MKHRARGTDGWAFADAASTAEVHAFGTLRPPNADTRLAVEGVAIRTRRCLVRLTHFSIVLKTSGARRWSSHARLALQGCRGWTGRRKCRDTDFSVIIASIGTDGPPDRDTLVILTDEPFR